jgi:YVTN family beta-propeller protein
MGMKLRNVRATVALGLTVGLVCPAFGQQAMHHMAPHEIQTPFARSMALSMERMDRDMMAAKMTGGPDIAFARMMIPHHQGAIDMARSELLYGKDPVLRRLAQDIIATQDQEIVLMRRRIGQLERSHTESSGRAERLWKAVPSGSGDRVYTGDQTSNTVSVIDPSVNKLLGVIRLGDPVPGSLSPLYKGQLLVHGLGFSPDGKTLAVVSIGSNSVTLIDTQTNRVKGTVYVGRSPHEAFFTPDGRELWVAVRGEDYLSIIDPKAIREIGRVKTVNGPGMILFRPDGKYAFVPSSFVPVLCVVDVKHRHVVAKVKQVSPFSPNLAVSKDGKEVWFTLKDSGKTQVISAQAPFGPIATLKSGPITNHVTLVENALGKFAFVSVGGENVVKVYRRGKAPELVHTIQTGDLPHGIWGSPDGARVYVGLENGGSVQAIDALKFRVIATIPVGQLPQALVYVPHAVKSGDGRENLISLGEAGRANHIALKGVDGSNATGNVVVNSLGLVDSLQLASSGLAPNAAYELRLVDSLENPREVVPLVRFTANIAGAGLAQALGPLRQAVTSNSLDGDHPRYLILVAVKTGKVVLVERSVS